METGSSRVGYGVRQEPRRLVVEDEPLICYLCKDTERDDKKKWALHTVASTPLRKYERNVIYISESYLPPPYLAPVICNYANSNRKEFGKSDCPSSTKLV